VEEDGHGECDGVQSVEHAAVPGNAGAPVFGTDGALHRRKHESAEEIEKLDTNVELEEDAMRLCRHRQTVELLADLVTRNPRSEGPVAISVLEPI